MNNERIYITINHLEDFNAEYSFKPGDLVTIRKDHNNCYDDEAIAAYDRNNCKVGFVANSVCTVARGTYSSGRVYDTFDEETRCTVRFIAEGFMICEVMEYIHR